MIFYLGGENMEGNHKSIFCCSAHYRPTAQAASFPSAQIQGPSKQVHPPFPFCASSPTLNFTLGPLVPWCLLPRNSSREKPPPTTANPCPRRRELAMAGEDAAAGGTAAAKKLPKEEDDDELDNVPLAVSRAKKARNASASKVKKDDDDDDEEDNRPISHSRAKKVYFRLVHPDLILRSVWGAGGASISRF